ncbi:MAG: UvrD-helicase domain-containing protein [Patescibacteria group bacterium]
MKHLESLNSEQKSAVLQIEGPLLILAGAGAGKTKTVTHRILHIVKQGIAPHQVLAITFTNKAAKEMRERVLKLIREDESLNMPVSFEEKPFVSTFHALGVHILKENSRLIDLNRHFTIFDKTDATSAVKAAVIEAGLDPKQFEPAKILRVISREKGNLTTVEAFTRLTSNEYFSNIVATVWKKYEEHLKKEQALDFDDLLLKSAILLRDHKEVLERYQSIWKYIHIDEYQDTNKVQYMIAKLLASKTRNLCVVGDIDQNIYSWRGADIKNIMDFEKDYPEAKVVTLEENYRSTKTILDTANAVIKKNKKRREKNLFTRQGAGEKIVMFEGYDEVEEAHFIAEKSNELIRGGVEPNEIAVLFRANFQSRILEEAFLAHSVPYQLLGTKFFERKEIKDALSYLRAALNPQGLADLKRIINEPPRGIGKVTLLKIFSGQEDSLSGAVRDKIQSFRNVLAQIRDLATREKPSSVMRFVISASGLEAEYKKGTEEDLERLENLQELVTLSTKYDHLPPVTLDTETSAASGLEKLIEEAALQSDQDEMKEAKNAVKLMTVHASKGLEFEHVFITGLEQDLFPHLKLSEQSMSESESEEERRLFYVALTRAKKRLYLTFAGVRTIFGSKRMNVPSEFLGDIADHNVEAASYEYQRPARTGRSFYFD